MDTLDTLECYEFQFGEAVSRCKGILNFLQSSDEDKELLYKIEVLTREHHAKNKVDLLSVVDNSMKREHRQILAQEGICSSERTNKELEKAAKGGNIYAHISLGCRGKMDEEWMDKILNSDIPGAVFAYVDSVEDVDSRVVDRLLKRDNEVEARKSLAQIYYLKKEPERAIDYYKKLYQSEKNDKYLWSVTKIYYELKNEKEFISYRPVKCVIKVQCKLNVTPGVLRDYPTTILEYKTSDRGGYGLVQIVDPRNGSVMNQVEIVRYDGYGIIQWLKPYEYYFV